MTNGREGVRGWINGNDGFAAAASGYSDDPSIPCRTKEFVAKTLPTDALTEAQASPRRSKDNSFQNCDSDVWP